MRCNGFACLEHWFRCGDPKCSPYYRICLKCQRESRFALQRTKDPKSIWVCQNCAKEARHSQNYMCDFCGEHYESLRTCRSCNRRVCQKDYFLCSVRSCSYSHCRNCNEDSPRDIQKTDGIWSCRRCHESEKAQAHTKTKNSKKHYHQHWKRRESGKAQAHTKTTNSKKHFHQRSKRRKTQQQHFWQALQRNAGVLQSKCEFLMAYSWNAYFALRIVATESGSPFFWS